MAITADRKHLVVMWLCKIASSGDVIMQFQFVSRKHVATLLQEIVRKQ